jgi:hypothetical protein
MFVLERAGDISFLHIIDDLNLMNHLTFLKNLEAGAFYDQIAKIHFQELSYSNLGNEFCTGFFLWVV